MALTQNNVIWNDEYRLRELELDADHKKLFKIAQMALDIEYIEEEQEVIKQLKKVLDELSFYVGTHFITEQAYMRVIQYPKLEEHTQIHKSIINKLNMFIKRSNSLSIEEIKNRLFKFIKSEFIDHITIEDKKIVDWEYSLDSAEKSFDWHSSFKLGDSLIDNENEQLFKVAQEAFKQADDNKRDKKIRKIVKYLYRYIHTSFKNEEALMNEVNYPKLAKHLSMHRKLIGQINQLVVKLPDANTVEFEKGLAVLIENTLIYHVMDQDEHFRKWYKENVKA